MDQQLESMNTILKSSIEEFTEVVSKEDMTVVLNLKQALTMKYREVNLVRSALINNEKAKDNPNFEETVNNVALVLQLIEDRITVVNVILEERREPKN